MIAFFALLSCIVSCNWPHAVSLCMWRGVMCSFILLFQIPKDFIALELSKNGASLYPLVSTGMLLFFPLHFLALKFIFYC